MILTKGSSINDVTVLRGGGQGFCDGSTKALVIKSVTMGEKIVQNCVTSCMYDPQQCEMIIFESLVFTLDASVKFTNSMLNFVRVFAY